MINTNASHCLWGNWGNQHACERRVIGTGQTWWPTIKVCLSVARIFWILSEPCIDIDKDLLQLWGKTMTLVDFKQLASSVYHCRNAVDDVKNVCHRRPQTASWLAACQEVNHCPNQWWLSSLMYVCVAKPWCVKGCHQLQFLHEPDNHTYHYKIKHVMSL